QQMTGVYGANSLTMLAQGAGPAGGQRTGESFTKGMMELGTSGAADPNAALTTASPASSTKAVGLGSPSRFADALQSPVSPKPTGIQSNEGMKGARHSPDIVNSWDSSLLGASAALASTTLDNLFAQSKVS